MPSSMHVLHEFLVPGIPPLCQVRGRVKPAHPVDQHQTILSCDVHALWTENHEVAGDSTLM